MVKKTTRRLPPDGWMLRIEIDSYGDHCLVIIAPRDEAQRVLSPPMAADLRDALNEAIDFMEGK